MRLNINLETGEDDLRGGSYPSFLFILRDGRQEWVNNFTDGINLPSGSNRSFSCDVKKFTDKSQVSAAYLIHTSVGGFSPDNWDLTGIHVTYPGDKDGHWINNAWESGDPIIEGKHIVHRFKSDTRWFLAWEPES